MKNLLPNKLSDCIDVALKDLDAAKKLGFKVDMDRWYHRQGQTCTVCLAGAVLAREFDLDMDEYTGPYNLHWIDDLISEHDYQRLHALNLVRQGFVVEALAQLYRVPKVWPQKSLTTTGTGKTDTKRWRKDMINIRDYLREQGL